MAQETTRVRLKDSTVDRLWRFKGPQISHDDVVNAALDVADADEIEAQLDEQDSENGDHSAQ